MGYINFDSTYRPQERPEQGVPIEELEEKPDLERSANGGQPGVDLVDVQEISTSFVTFRVQDNILAQSTEHKIQVIIIYCEIPGQCQWL